MTKKRRKIQSIRFSESEIENAISNYKPIPWARDIFKKNYRFLVCCGGRNTGRSTVISEKLVLDSFIKGDPTNIILCARKFKDATDASQHAQVVKTINKLGLINCFIINRDTIVNKFTNTIFYFKGFKFNIENLKSMTDLFRVWIEESDSMTESEFMLIEPTVRARAVDAESQAQMIFTFNPKYETDFIYKHFILNQPNSSLVLKANYLDNPYIDEFVLDSINYLKEYDYEKYEHIYLGGLRTVSESQIFKGKFVVRDFEEKPNMHLFFGLDWGFSVDPLAAIRCYVDDDCLYITHEFVKHELALDHTGSFLECYLPDYKKHGRYVMKCDSADPVRIDYLNRHGYPAIGARKPKGSVEAGIEYIKAFKKIYIHSRCTHVAQEFSRYSYEVDDRSEQITIKPEDKWNHCIDALRYALEDAILVSKVTFSNNVVVKRY
jgi:phage terminase large subunit